MIDILMYCKHKIVNGVSTDGISDLLRKAKTAVIKVLVSPDYRSIICTLNLPYRKDFKPDFNQEDSAAFKQNSTEQMQSE